MKILGVFIAVFLSYSVFASNTDATISTTNYEKNVIKTSPSGKYISQLASHKGKKVLVIFDATTKEHLHIVNFKDTAQVGHYQWVNDERIVLEKEYIKNWTNTPFYYGELYAINADGSRPMYLTGFTGHQYQTGSRIKRNTPLSATSFLLDPMQDNRRDILIKSTAWGNDETVDFSKPVTIYKVDVFTGLRKKMLTTASNSKVFVGVNKNGDIKVSQQANIKNAKTYELSYNQAHHQNIPVVVTSTNQPKFILNGKKIVSETHLSE